MEARGLLPVFVFLSVLGAVSALWISETIDFQQETLDTILPQADAQNPTPVTVYDLRFDLNRAEEFSLPFGHPNGVCKSLGGEYKILQTGGKPPSDTPNGECSYFGDIPENAEIRIGDGIKFRILPNESGQDVTRKNFGTIIVDRQTNKEFLGFGIKAPTLEIGLNVKFENFGRIETSSSVFTPTPVNFVVQNPAAVVDMLGIGDLINSIENQKDAIDTLERTRDFVNLGTVIVNDGGVWNNGATFRNGQSHTSPRGDGTFIVKPGGLFVNGMLHEFERCNPFVCETFHQRGNSVFVVEGNNDQKGVFYNQGLLLNYATINNDGGYIIVFDNYEPAVSNGDTHGDQENRDDDGIVNEGIINNINGGIIQSSPPKEAANLLKDILLGKLQEIIVYDVVLGSFPHIDIGLELTFAIITIVDTINSGNVVLNVEDITNGAPHCANSDAQKKTGWSSIQNYGTINNDDKSLIRIICLSLFEHKSGTIINDGLFTNLGGTILLDSTFINNGAFVASKHGSNGVIKNSYLFLNYGSFDMKRSTLENLGIFEDFNVVRIGESSSVNNDEGGTFIAKNLRTGVVDPPNLPVTTFSNSGLLQITEEFTNYGTLKTKSLDFTPSSSTNPSKGIHVMQDAKLHNFGFTPGDFLVQGRAKMIVEQNGLLVVDGQLINDGLGFENVNRNQGGPCLRVGDLADITIDGTMVINKDGTFHNNADVLINDSGVLENKGTYKNNHSVNARCAGSDTPRDDPQGFNKPEGSTVKNKGSILNFPGATFEFVDAVENLDGEILGDIGTNQETKGGEIINYCHATFKNGNEAFAEFRSDGSFVNYGNVFFEEREGEKHKTKHEWKDEDGVWFAPGQRFNNVEPAGSKRVAIIEKEFLPENYRLIGWEPRDDFWDRKGIFYDYGKRPSITVAPDGRLVEVHDNGDDRLWYRIGQLLGDTITWPSGEAGKHYDSGYSPNIITVGGKLVEVHDDGDKGLYYRVGQLQDNKVIWNTANVEQGGKFFDRGFSSNIIKVDGKLVEVHDDGDKGLYYRVGERQGDIINWNTADVGNSGKFYDTGKRPSITVAPNGKLVEVHDNGNDRLFYRVGTLQGNTIHWNTANVGNSGKHYDSGFSPNIITVGGKLVEVHDDGDKELFYRVGELRDNTIHWNTANVGNSGKFYDTGKRPSITVAPDGRLVEVHDDGDGGLWYRIGHLQGNTISWNTGASGQRYDSGFSPSIDTVDGKLVEVHDNNNGGLYYRIGHLQGNTISWDTGASGKRYDDGERPSILSVGGKIIVEVHDNGNDRLFYRIGQLDNNQLIWHTADVKQAGKKYDTGKRPSITVAPDGKLVEVHDNNNDRLFYRVGQLQGNEIHWNTADVGNSGKHYDSGFSPNIITVGGKLIEVHDDGDGGLYYRIGELRGNTIDWNTADVGNSGKRYDGGKRPSITVAPDGRLVEVHDNGDDRLWYRIGTLQGNTISWDTGASGQRYDSGFSPHIITVGGKLVEVHDDGDRGLYYSIGSLVQDPITSSSLHPDIYGTSTVNVGNWEQCPGLEDLSNDFDRDGIYNEIDPEPNNPDNHTFDDGQTSGIILSGAQFLTISDVLGSGVNVVSTGTTEISACGFESITFTAGESTIICGSITIDVVSGTVEIQSPSQPKITLNAGANITIEDTLEITNNSDTPAVILVNGKQITIDAEKTITLEQESSESAASQIQSLIDNVDSLVPDQLDSRTARSLQWLLNAALSAEQGGDSQTAQSKLNSFESRVTMFANRGIIDQSVGDELVDTSSTITFTGLE